MNETLFATQQQVQQLQEQYAEVTQANKVLVNEIVTLQKMVNAQKQSQQEMLNYLLNEERRRGTGSAGSLSGAVQLLQEPIHDQPAELRRAKDLLSSVAPNAVADRELERLNGLYAQASPPESASSILYHGGAGTPGLPMLNEHLVYPAGQTVGIDPFHQDHINKIPYSLPSSGGSISGMNPDMASPSMNAQANPQDTSIWGAKKPRILLVEDDPTCSRIGSKFLAQLECYVEVAVSTCCFVTAEWLYARLINC
jgi:osomolarity two-component system, response regulator SKN7